MKPPMKHKIFSSGPPKFYFLLKLYELCECCRRNPIETNFGMTEPDPKFRRPETFRRKKFLFHW